MRRKAKVAITILRGGKPIAEATTLDSLMSWVWRQRLGGIRVAWVKVRYVDGTGSAHVLLSGHDKSSPHYEALVRFGSYGEAVRWAVGVRAWQNKVLLEGAGWV